MSIASPTLRSSSRIEPADSCSSWATDMWARPSTAEMLTGTSNTGARSEAILSLSSTGISEANIEPPNSSRVRLSSDMTISFR